MAQVMKWGKRLTVFVSLLFLLELIFGYAGTVVTVHGTAIRILLFALSAVLLYLYSFLLVLTEHIPVFSRRRDAVLGSLRFHDWALLLFSFSTALSVFVFPRLSGGSPLLAKNEAFGCLCMLLLYFPIAFLIRRGELSPEKLDRVLRAVLFLFALQHIFLYIGQSAYGGFIGEAFDFLRRIFGENAEFPQIILGHGGYPRVIFLTSIYLLVGVYLVLRRLPKFGAADGLSLAVYLTALLATMTKSVWYGALLGLAAFSVCYAVRCIRQKLGRELLRYAGILVGCFLLILLLNATVFDRMVSVRFLNSFSTSDFSDSLSEEEEEEDELAALDRAGAVISNNIKIEQTKKLLQKWTRRPLFGYGYGSYVKGYLRSYEAPYSYEMQLPALLMKIGIVGVGLLFLVIVAMLWALLRSVKRGGGTVPVFAWLFLLFAFGFTVQTNPLLLTYNGISIVLYLMLITTDLEQQALLHTDSEVGA